MVPETDNEQDEESVPAETDAEGETEVEEDQREVKKWKQVRVEIPVPKTKPKSNKGHTPFDIPCDRCRCTDRVCRPHGTNRSGACEECNKAKLRCSLVSAKVIKPPGRRSKWQEERKSSFGSMEFAEELHEEIRGAREEIAEVKSTLRLLLRLQELEAERRAEERDGWKRKRKEWDEAEIEQQFDYEEDDDEEMRRVKRKEGKRKRE